ncbi:hypothetical protein SDC9_206041 [bioreactor metagenome]|uniref:Uncharacterized protein n=1 Tax=bioreactor metagenome TaxID=1076179 RepID=A0A645J4M0_9ZZZZ
MGNTVNTDLANELQNRFYIYFRRSQQRFAERAAKLLTIKAKGLFRNIKDLSYERKAVGMYAA